MKVSCIRTLGVLVSCLWTSLGQMPVSGALVAYFPFDGDATDATGNGHDGTVFGATLGSGFTGQAYDFAGLSAFDHVSVPLDINPSTYPKLTMGAWVQPDSLPPGGINQEQALIVSHDDGWFDRAFGLQSWPASPSGWAAFAGGNGVIGPNQSIAVPSATWTFVAVVYDQTTTSATMYLDNDASTTGDPLTTASGTATHFTGNSFLYIGASPCCGDQWDGRIDNVFFFDEALSAEQVNAIRVAGTALPVPEPSILALLPGAIGLWRISRRVRRISSSDGEGAQSIPAPLSGRPAA